MIRFIWKNWWRHKERFILLIVGVIIISSGLSYLVSLTETNRGTIEEMLQQRWRASYDIVVRPPGTRSITEDDNLLEPNYQSGISGGISIDQYQTIKAIEEVSVAAPISVIGYTGSGVTFQTLRSELGEPGIYRVTMETYADNGIKKEKRMSMQIYHNSSTWRPKKENVEDLDPYKPYGISNWDRRLASYSQQLLVGIDPEQEARLVGLHQAVVEVGTSRYFSQNDKTEVKEGDGVKFTRLPLLISSKSFVDEQYHFKIEKLDLPVNDREIASKTMDNVKENGGEKYLHQVKTVSTQEYQFSFKEGHRIFSGLLTGIDPNNGETFKNNGHGVDFSWIIAEKTSPLTYEKTTSPYPEKWPFAYSVSPMDTKLNYMDDEVQAFRPVVRYGERLKDMPKIDPYWIGFYNPGKLNLAVDPLTDLPMETYRPASARLVLHDNGLPVNPANPLGTPYDLLTSPPVLLTTLDAANHIMGDSPISTIRVKVKGVTDLSDDSQKILEKVAQEIEDKTGLITDITLGSSPQPTLVHIKETESSKSLGWIEQPWIKIGASIGLYKESKLGFSNMIMVVIFVAIVYVLSTNLVSFFTRKKDFAILLALGWRHNQLIKMMFVESLLIGSFVSLVSIGMASFVMLQSGTAITATKFVFIGTSGLFIYVIGGILPALLMRNIETYVAIRWGEASGSRRIVKSTNLFFMAFNQLISKWKRSILSIISIAVPTSLIIVLMFITFRLKGIMFTTWLGQYVGMQVGPAHYVVIGIAFLISILTTSEIIWLNVSEQKKELALLKAIGWRNQSIRRLIITEGLLTGAIGGLIGTIIGLCFIYFIYQTLPPTESWMLLIALIPLFAGVLGAILPAEIAVRSEPNRGLRGEYSTTLRNERGFLKTILTVCLFGMIGIAVSAVNFLPKETVSKQIPTNTEGNLILEDDQTETAYKKLGLSEGYSPLKKESKSQAKYNLHLQMLNESDFTGKATIDVKNLSKNNWMELVFYFIPNALKTTNAIQKNPGKANIQSLKVNGNEVDFSIEKDTLRVPLMSALSFNQTATVEVEFTFTPPIEGFRFSSEKDHYQLAQWYPMLATYFEDEGWNKENYTHGTETYLTTHSDFHVSYEILEEYVLASSADNDAKPGNSKGSFSVKNAKEVFIGIIKKPISKEVAVNDVNIRVITGRQNEHLIDHALNTATEALKFMEQKVGDYPYNQLDIIIGRGANMEYPGIVTVNEPGNADFFFDHVIVHEIAHQWFYGIVNNDPYSEGWLDEGLTEFSTSLFFLVSREMSERDAFTRSITTFKSRKEDLPSNLSVPGYHDTGFFTYLYAQPTLKLWELAEMYGGEEVALQFLADYYRLYAYSIVTTEEFVRFTQEYFGVSQAFFSDWLKFEQEYEL